MGFRVARRLSALRVARDRARLREQLAETRTRASLSLAMLRRELRLSKAQLARICGVSRNTVERWEDPASPSTPDAAQLGALVAECGPDAGRWLVRLLGLPWTD